MRTVLLVVVNALFAIIVVLRAWASVQLWPDDRRAAVAVAATIPIWLVVWGGAWVVWSGDTRRWIGWVAAALAGAVLLRIWAVWWSRGRRGSGEA